MFIFNAFLAERNLSAVPLRKLLLILDAFDKNESAIRMGLSRAVQSGILINTKQDNEVFYEFTEQGLHQVNRWRQSVTRFQSNIERQRSRWNGQWHAIVIDESSPYRYALIKRLSELYYGRLGTNLWISAFPFSAEIWAALPPEVESETVLQMWEVKNIGGMTDRNLAAAAWPIKRMSRQYMDYRVELEAAATQFYGDEVSASTVLPFIHTYGKRLFEIMSGDPQLPTDILPEDWPGLATTRRFTKIRARVLPIADAYIDSILKA